MIPVGLPPGGPTTVDVFDIVARMIKIKGSWIGNAADLNEALEVFQSKQLKVPHKLMSLEDLPLVYEMLEKGERKMIIFEVLY